MRHEIPPLASTLGRDDDVKSMGQSKAQSAGGFPLFERPSEAVVFWVLENLCRGAGGKCKITFADLARQCSLAMSTVKRAVHRLADRKVIRFQAGCNQYQGSVYEVVCGNNEMLKQKQMLKGKQILKHDSHAASRGVQDDGKGGDTRDMVPDGADSIASSSFANATEDSLQNDKIRCHAGGPDGVRASGGRSAGVDVSQSRSAGPKIGQPNPRDISCITNDLYIGDKHDRRVVHNKQADSTQRHGQGSVGLRSDKGGNSDPSDEERLAFQVAEGLGDVKNLRLYKSYCRRYPTEIILTAYVRAREVSPDKIKKSRGALFNFLVQKYGGKNKNNSGGSGFAAGTAGDGRGCAGSR